MRIAVLGAGAIGSLFGGLLKNQDNDVVLVGRKQHVDAINQNGLQITGVSGKKNIKIKAYTDVSTLDKIDLIILTVKAYATKQALESAANIISNNTFILNLQNGLGLKEIIVEHIDESSYARAITSNGAAMESPGKIKHFSSINPARGKALRPCLGHSFRNRGELELWTVSLP